MYPTCQAREAGVIRIRWNVVEEVGVYYGKMSECSCRFYAETTQMRYSTCSSSVFDPLDGGSRSGVVRGDLEGRCETSRWCIGLGR